MKIISLYLPQFHEVEENNKWWGNGFTEWTTVKRGKVLVEGQYQPRVPLNDNYYNLLDADVIKWQTELAKQNGVYGFCMYHYWFNGIKLLEKPVELLLKHREIDFPFYLCWANEQWTTIWKGEKYPKVLMAQHYSDKKDIDEHFYYLLPFFKDSRYMRRNEKPIFSIMNPIMIEPRLLHFLINRWNYLAKKEGLNGISFEYMYSESLIRMPNKEKQLFDYAVEYEPDYVEYLENNVNPSKMHYKLLYLSQELYHLVPSLREFVHGVISPKSKDIIPTSPLIKDYDEEWDKVLSIKHDDFSKYIPGGFVGWDNTARKGCKGKVILNNTPEKFQKYLELLIHKAKEKYNSDRIVLFAWNEWSEGGYLEPDEKWGTAYLQAIKKALLNTNELE